MGDAVDLRVERVPLHATAGLRDRVLRPNGPRTAVTWAALDVAGAATFAVFVGDRPADGDAASEAIATVTVMPRACPWRPDATAPWRLRGMATDDGWRGRGVGRCALDTAVDHVSDRGASVLWCNARIAASSFYERAGFVVEGEEFDVGVIGPHYPMARPISAA